MAHCDESIELISAALDGALSPEEQTRLDRHLAQCPDCKALYEDLTQIHQSLLDLPLVKVPHGLTDRIMDAVAAEARKDKVVPLPQPRKATFPWQRWAAMAAAVAVVILGARIMERPKLADESIIAPAQALPSAEPGLRTYSDRSIVPESDVSDVDSVETVGDSASVQARNTEIAPVSPQPTVESIPNQPRLTPAPSAAPPSPVPSVVPEDAPVPSNGISPRMAIGQKTSPVPADTSEPDNGENTGDTQSGEQVSPSTFALQSPSSLESPLLPDPVEETVVPNNMLLTSAGNGPVSVDDDPEETLPLTPKEAMALAAELCPALENATLVDSEERLALETPLTPVGGDSAPHVQQVSTRLEYLGQTPNGNYHEFWLYSFLSDEPETGLAHSSTLNFYAVPMGGGEILVQRMEMPDDSEESLTAYEAGIQTYLETTGYLDPSETGEGSPPPSELPQP